MRVSSAIAAVVLVFGLLVAPALAGKSAGAVSTGRSAIVFADREPQSSMGIYAIRPDDGFPRPILRRPGVNFSDPVWSPDGTMIAFRRQVTETGWHLMVMRADGTQVREVSSLRAVGNPAWSPDGSRLAFGGHATFGGVPQLHVVNLDGTGLDQLTDGPVASAFPLWSVDGLRLYFLTAEAVFDPPRLYQIDIDGTNREAMTDEPVSGIAQSPDGMTLAVGIAVDEVTQVHLVPAAGGEPVQVTDEDVPQTPRSYSPDGDRLLVGDLTFDSETLTTMALDGSDRQPIWTPSVTGSADWGIPAFVDTIGSRFASDIAWAVQEGLTDGCDIAEFCPHRPLTRAELATLVARALDLPAAVDDHFTDDDGTAHEDAINRIADAGIVVGCGPSRFCPSRAVIRGEMAAILDRAVEPPATLEDYFVDDEGRPDEAAINRIRAAGIAAGCTADRFCPTASLTRAQAVAFLHRALT